MKKIDKTGSLKDPKNSGRPRSGRDPEDIAALLDSVA